LEGQRYFKEVSFRYKAENDETVSLFKINDSLWIEQSSQVPEYTLLSLPDGRTDTTNSDAILNYISDNTAETQEGIPAAELVTEFVDSHIMSKSTMFNNLKKLM
jgi:hypothetical protein